MKNKLLLFFLLGIIIYNNSNAQCGAGARNPAKDAFVPTTGAGGIQDVSVSPNGQYTAFVGIGSRVSSYGNSKGTTTGGVPTLNNIVHILDANYNYVSSTTSTARTFPKLNTTNGPASGGATAVWRIKYLPNGGLITMSETGSQLAYLAPGAASWVLSPTSGTGGYLLSILSSDPIQVVGGDTILCITSTRYLVYYVGSQNRFYDFTTPLAVPATNTDAYCYVNGNVYYQNEQLTGTGSRCWTVNKASFPAGVISSTKFYYNAYSAGSSANRELQALCVRGIDGMIFAVFAPIPTMYYESQDLYSGSGALLNQSSHNTVNGDFIHVFAMDQNCVQTNNQIDQRYLNLLFPIGKYSYFRFDQLGNIYFNNNYNEGNTNQVVLPTTFVKLNITGGMQQDFFINQTDYSGNQNFDLNFNGFSIYPTDGRLVTTGADFNGLVYDRPCDRTNGSDHSSYAGTYSTSGADTSSKNSLTDRSNIGNFCRGMMLFSSVGKMDCAGGGNGVTGCQTISIDCSTLTLTAAPTSGTAAAGLILSGTVNVTGAAGNFPIKVSGPGFTSAQNYVAISSLGTQTLNIPVNYDGTAFTSSNSITFTISSPTGAGSTTCSLPLKNPVNVLVPTIKGATNCLPTQGPIMK